MSAVQLAPHNLEAEQAVLGAVLLTGEETLGRLLLDVRLRPEHFYREQHGTIYAAMVAMHDADRAIDALTVTERLREQQQLEAVGGEVMVDVLSGAAPAAGNAAEYGRVVVRLARWRHRLVTLQHGLAAVDARDEDGFEAVEAALAAGDADAERRTRTAEEIGHEIFDWFGPSGEDDALALPFPVLNTALAGGLRPGDVTWIGGWTSHGKSILVDGILEHAAAAGARCHLYHNEMSRRDRALRQVAALSGVPFHLLLARQLGKQQLDAVASAVSKLPFGMTDCSGWTAAELSRHVRRNRWDLAAIDSVNLVRKQPGRHGVDAIDEVSSTINAAARQADCHLLGVLMLNRERQRDGIDPVPVLRDIRESGRLEYDAANVLFVHREQEPITIGGQETGRFRQTPDGVIVLAKARNGERDTGVKVTLNSRTMRFEPRLERP